MLLHAVYHDRLRSCTVMLKTSGILIALLLAGLVASVLLAASACLWSIRTSGTQRMTGAPAWEHLRSVSGPLEWSPQSRSGPHASDTIICEITRGPGFRHSAFTLQKIGAGEKRGGRIEWRASSTGSATEFGWPLRSFIAEDLAFAGDKSNRLQRADFRPSIVLARITELAATSRLLVIPVIVNAAIFAAAFWVSAKLTRGIRATYRVRKGRCAVCGYPVGTSAVCVECSAPIR